MDVVLSRSSRRLPSCSRPTRSRSIKVVCWSLSVTGPERLVILLLGSVLGLGFRILTSKDRQYDVSIRIGVYEQSKIYKIDVISLSVSP